MQVQENLHYLFNLGLGIRGAQSWSKSGNFIIFAVFLRFLTNFIILYYGQHFYIRYLTQNKMNLFVLSGHRSESFAAFLNKVILHNKKNNAAVITAAVITTHHESELRFR